MGKKAFQPSKGNQVNRSTIQASISIGRDSSDTIRIRITDNTSRVQFVDLKMSPHDFAMAATGLSFVPVVATVNGLEYVGMRKVSEPRTIECPLDTYDRGRLSAWLIDNAQEPGWTLDAYLGSQGSISTTLSCSGRTLRYRVYKFVNVTQETA